jgi:hypothetical protein
MTNEINKTTQSSTEGMDSWGSFLKNSVSTGSTSLQIKTETNEEQSFRLRKEEKEGNFKRIGDAAVLCSCLLISFILIIVCLVFIKDPNLSADDKKTAWSVITVIIGAYAGYLAGRKSNG